MSFQASEETLSERVQYSAPQWLKDKFTNELLGVKYLDAKGPSYPNIDPEKGFCCWGFVWYYFSLCGIVLPLDPYEAEKQTVETRDRLRWRDVISYRSMIFSPIPHLGIMEDERMVLHCSSETDGVARTNIVLMPTPAKTYRHLSLA